MFVLLQFIIGSLILAFPGSDGLLSTSGEEYPYTEVRIPTYVHPTNYIISIHPNLTTLEVTGWVVIQLFVDQETPFIVFHTKQVNITDKIMKEGIVNDDASSDADKLIGVKRILEYVAFQQQYLEFDSPLQPGKNYSLLLRYDSKISHELEGFYISSYIGADGEKHLLATTHFQAAFARTAFPCFDEPKFKATFKLFLTHEKKHKALFNMPLKDTQPVDGTDFVRDEFDVSVSMSTYLVAFIVCDYDRITNKTLKGIEVSIYTPPNQIGQAKFSLDLGVPIIDYYEEFFGIPYPLPKEDMVAIPDFGAGAMENWGLITYRDTSVLFDAAESSSAAQQRVAMVVSHELAHQWFGNLVTMEWWNDLWLNEGFASLIQYFGVDRVLPEWRVKEHFVLEETHTALSLDALASSHPISVVVKEPSEIGAIFDAISYNKGASILKMLETFMGEERLRNGLRDYLSANKYQNAKMDDLWSALSKAMDNTIDVKTVMETWTVQMGFPLIRVKLEGRILKITQEKFAMQYAEHQTAKENDTAAVLAKQRWFVPLSYITDVEPTEAKFVYINKTDGLDLAIAEGVAWVKFNVNQTGFYRISYDVDSWNVLVGLVLSDPLTFSPADRASFLDDAYTLTRSGYESPLVPLELSQYLPKETEYVPWATAFYHWRGWYKLLFERPSHKLLGQYILRAIEPIYQSLGWEDTGSHSFKLLRGQVMDMAIHFEHAEAISEARKLFNNWMFNGIKVAPNLRHVVYSAGIKYGGIAAWDFCWEQFTTTLVSSERNTLLSALGYASDPWLLQQYLDYTLNPEKLRSQDIRSVMYVVAANPVGKYLAWRHLRAHWDKIDGIFGGGSFIMGNIISGCTAYFTTKFDFNEVTTFFKNRSAGSGQRALEQSIEKIQMNIQWLRQNEKIIEEWLTAHQPKKI